MKNKILSMLAVLAVAVSMVGCTVQTNTPTETTEQIIAETTVTTPFGYEEAIVVDDETMDFWRSLLCIKGDPITFPCTYNELKTILDKHGLTIKPAWCWTDDNLNDRDGCMVDLYDGETYFMPLTGTCISEDDLESYIFDGTVVTPNAKDYISINKHDPIYIGDNWSNDILGVHSDKLQITTLENDIMAECYVKSDLLMCGITFHIDKESNSFEGFSINVDNIGENRAEQNA